MLCLRVIMRILPQCVPSLSTVSLLVLRPEGRWWFSSRKPGLGTSLIQVLETPSTAYGLAQGSVAYAQTGEQTYDMGVNAALGLTPLPACGEGLGERR